MRRLYHERLEKKAFKMSIVLMLRDLEPEDRSRIVNELTAKEFEIPYSNKKTISRTTLYAWLKEYQEREDPSGVLMHKERCDRLSFRLFTEEQKKALMRWRYENKYRTVAQLREELSVHESINSGKLPSESTIARFLRTVGLDRRTLLKKDRAPVKVRLAYEAPYPQRL
jgi:mRNA deadenylase 3'-5' endonuclease subunit Ccr4